MSRYEKYKKSDLPPLIKLAVGESFVGKRVGEHEYEPPDGDPALLVLDLEDASGQPFGWKASTWRAVEELEDVDPRDGDWIKVARLPNRGKSYDWRIEIVDPATPLNEDGDEIAF